MKNSLFEDKTAPADAGQVSPGEIVIGVFEGYDQNSKPLVNFTENPANKPIAALSTVSMKSHHRGRQVALLFADGEEPAKSANGPHIPTQCKLPSTLAKNTAASNVNISFYFFRLN